MFALSISFAALILISFYFSLTLAATLPARDTITPLTCSGGALSLPAQGANLNSTTNLGRDRPSCLPASSPRNFVTYEQCTNALAQLVRVSRTRWPKNRYEWSSDGGECNIVLKAEKEPPVGGGVFDVEAIVDAAVSITELCGVPGGTPRPGTGKGGSWGLERVAKNVPEGQWRVWVLGNGGAVESEELENQLGDGMEQPGTLSSGCTS